MKNIIRMAYLYGCILWLSSCFNGSKVSTPTPGVTNNIETSAVSFYDLKAKTLDGEEISLSQYKGKRIILLNTASKCGYTPQYADWQAFYDKNKENTVVLGFPCNQFLGQEPGSAVEIETFCQKNYGVTFPMFEKIDVKGETQSPIYKWLSDKTQNGWCSDVPSWNFCKYYINEKGELKYFFGSKIKPDSPEFTQAFQ
jgi:glutathione peroxidase